MGIKKEQLRLYAITDNGCIGGRGLCECVEAALRGGAGIIQLRDKSADHAKLVSEAKLLLTVCRKYGAPLIVNDDWRAAIEAGADGAHVGIEDTPPDEIRRAAGAEFIIGATAKTVGQAAAAEAAGADYLGVGALFPSPTKTAAVPVSKEQFSEIAASVNIPCVAIGGISAGNLPEILNIGAAGYAVVSAVFGQQDIEAAARRLCGIISGQG